MGREGRKMPSKVTQPPVFELDAKGKVLGRLATQVAMILMGKNNPHYTANLAPVQKVVVKNVKEMILTGKKLEQKIYYRHTNWPRGLRATTLKDLMARDPGQVLHLAVEGMLPKNKLRKLMLRNLETKNEEV